MYDVRARYRNRLDAGTAAFEWAIGLLMLVVALLGVFWLWQARETALPKPQGPRAGGPEQAQAARRVYFVPLGDVPPHLLERLVAYCKDKFSLTIETLQAVPLESAVVDDETRQLIAEELLALMRRHHARLADDPQAILIGITSDDMYLRVRPARRFGLAAGEMPRYAVLSTARMEAANPGEEPDPLRLYTRLRKMVSKHIGLMYFRLPQSSNRRSVLYAPILGVDDLDSIGEDF